MRPAESWLGTERHAPLAPWRWRCCWRPRGAARPVRRADTTGTRRPALVQSRRQARRRVHDALARRSPAGRHALGVHDDDGRAGRRHADVRSPRTARGYTSFRAAARGARARSRRCRSSARSIATCCRRACDREPAGSRGREARSRRNPNSLSRPIVAGSIQSLLDRATSPRRATALAFREPAAAPGARGAARGADQPEEPAADLRPRSRSPSSQGALRFYREQVPALDAQGCRDSRIQADLAEADSAGGAARSRTSSTYLREDLLSRSTATFALGTRDLRSASSRPSEMETHAGRHACSRAGRRELERPRTRMGAVAERIAPGAGVEAALESLDVERAPPDATSWCRYVVRAARSRSASSSRTHLHPDAARDRRTCASARRRCSAAARRSPRWTRRACGEAGDRGLLQRHARRAERGLDGRSATTSRSSTAGPPHIVSIHEALPGHYYQFLALQQRASRGAAGVRERAATPRAGRTTASR